MMTHASSIPDDLSEMHQDTPACYFFATALQTQHFIFHCQVQELAREPLIWTNALFEDALILKAIYSKR